MSMALQILIMWIITIITSRGMDLMLSFKMFKDIADAGYKFDANRVNEVNQQLNPRAKEATKLERMIPLYNIMKACNRINLYVKHRDIILSQFDVMDVLEEMSKLEKEEYAKKPTGFNAILAPAKVKIRLSKASSITITDEQGQSKIYFEMGDKPFDFKILQVTGPLSNLSEQEQKRAILESYKKLVEGIEEEFGDFKKFAEACKKNDEVIINKKEKLPNEDKGIDDQAEELKSISEQKEELQELRDQLTGDQRIHKEDDRYHKKF